MAISVLIVDSHHMFREGVCEILRSRRDIEVAGQASDGIDAVRQISARPIDIAILSAALPGQSGIETVAQIKESGWKTRCIVLGESESEGSVRAVLRAGASGYVLKSSSSTELLEAIDATFSGQWYVSPSISEHLAGALSSPDDAGQRGIRGLTSRQRDVLRLIAEECSSKEIGAKLGLSPRTVECHRSSLKDRLGIDSTAKLVRFAVREGLVSD